MAPSIHTILVGTDFSEGSARALEHAVNLAQKLSARLDLLYVLDLPPPAWGEVLLGPDDGDPTLRALGQLRELREKIVEDRVPTWLHVREGHPVTGFLSAIDELKPDLVIVGTHGRGALARMLMGSVSERLCRTSKVPVMVVPEPRPHKNDARQPTPDEGVVTAPAPDAMPAGKDIAWSCAACGHMRKGNESLDRCSKCGVQPGNWTSAPVQRGPVDQLEPASSSGLASPSEQGEKTQDPGGLFPTAPAGVEGYSVNAELRVRY